MATRINRKNPNTPATREIVGTDKVNKSVEEPNSGSNISAKMNTTPLAKNVGEKSGKKPGRKPIGIKLKAKAKQTAKINKKLKKKIIQGAKNLENSEKSLRNGLKGRKMKIAKLKTNIKKEDDDDVPPVLEPSVPFVEPTNTKKNQKKRTKNQADTLTQTSLTVKKIKVEPEEETSLLNDVEDLPIMETNKKQFKKRGGKNNKNLSEPVEETFNDMTSFLVKKEDERTDVDSLSDSTKTDSVKGRKITRKQKLEPFEHIEEINPPIIIKEEPQMESEITSDSEKVDVLKSKKIVKNQRIELLKKQVFKKDNLGDTIEKFDEINEKVIDALDLNVRTIKRKSVSKRRHSIEKFPLGSVDDLNISQLFSHLPRSMSPRSKRQARMRQSNDSMSRRSSPYSTRSDSPARILRNGKQRKWIDMNLIEGLDTDAKKRKRLCSDLSGSEISGSKLSEYESDSSFSDLASCQGTENIEESSAKNSTFKECIEGAIEVSNVPSEKDSSKDLVDTNSNVCNSLKKCEIKPETVSSPCDSGETIVKVPDKSVILDIMKQVFNEPAVDNSLPPSTFYGKEKNDEITETVSDVNVSETLAINEPLTNNDDNVETAMQIEENINDEETKLETISEALISDTVDDNNTEMIDELYNDIYETLSNVIDKVEKLEEEQEAPALKTFENEFTCLEPDEHNPPELVNQVAIENNSMDEDDQSIHLAENGLVENENTESELPKIENCVTQNSEMTETAACSNSKLDSEIVDNEDNVNNSIVNADMEIVDNVDNINNSIANADMEMDIDTREPVAENDPNSVHNANSPHEGPAENGEKENILKALGLQSLKDAAQVKQTQEESVDRSENYTGTLKTVIKLNRDKKKGGRIGSIKMAVQGSKYKVTSQEIPLADENSSKDSDDSNPKYEVVAPSDTHRKTHSHRSNTEGSNEHISDGEGTSQDDTIKALVIPEKASSFSIHPGRLCKDECSYCFGKFGLFDTPCHIAQMKSIDRQDKILATEKHLMRDSCLCDACYRHVDRKSNTPSYMNKSLKRNSLVAPGPKENHCHVLGCNNLSTNILRRKWIIKMKKNICKVINIDLDNPGLHSIPICDGHYSALEHLMICSMCKRRLARNHIHYLGPETNALKSALVEEGIPIALTDKPVVCKLCKCFASIILKDAEERTENSISFFNEYKRRLLHFNDILPMDESAAEEPISVPTRPDKSDQSRKKKKSGKNTDETDSVNSSETNEEKNERLVASETSNEQKSRSESPADEYNVVDYNTLIPAIAMDCGSDSESKSEPPSTQPIIIKKIVRNDKSQDAIEISKVQKSNINKNKSDIAVQKLGSNPSISVRQLFPGEEDLPLGAQIDFSNVKDHTPEGWEKCTSVIQYDAETKRLWQELQKPYGNQSSFLRHLILLEKYFRNGDLVLSSHASHHSINYSESVHNRLRAYDNISASAKNVQPLSMIPFNKMHEKYNAEAVPGTSSASVTASQTSPTNSNQKSITTTAVNRLISNNSSVTVTPQSSISKIKGTTALTITQLNHPILTSGSTVLQQIRPKMSTAPPGLISLQPGTSRPAAPLVKVPQSQKIKFPITKNWRPNLIPIDPTKKQDRKTGLVQVISGGKPYHITLEDYKKMCAIKRSFEMKQRRLQEVQNAKPILVTHNSVLKSITPRKGLIISKAIATNVPVKVEPQPTASSYNNGENENILQKLDKQVEKLDSKLNEKTSSLLLPRIPKSLTVIPQSVSKPSSPVLEITPKVSSKS